MATEQKIFNRLTSVSDLQDEPLPRFPLVEIVGDCRVLIERHMGITEYGKERILVKVRMGQICVCGAELENRAGGASLDGDRDGDHRLHCGGYHDHHCSGSCEYRLYDPECGGSADPTDRNGGDHIQTPGEFRADVQRHGNWPDERHQG